MPRDTRYTNSEPDGTYCQELVVFPTLAPQLAHRQNVGCHCQSHTSRYCGKWCAFLWTMFELTMFIRKSACCL